MIKYNILISVKIININNYFIFVKIRKYLIKSYVGLMLLHNKEQLSSQFNIKKYCCLPPI